MITLFKKNNKQTAVYNPIFLIPSTNYHGKFFRSNPYKNT